MITKFHGTFGKAMEREERYFPSRGEKPPQAGQCLKTPTALSRKQKSLPADWGRKPEGQGAASSSPRLPSLGSEAARDGGSLRGALYFCSKDGKGPLRGQSREIPGFSFSFFLLSCPGPMVTLQQHLARA